MRSRGRRCWPRWPGSGHGSGSERRSSPASQGDECAIGGTHDAGEFASRCQRRRPTARSSSAYEAAVIAHEAAIAAQATRSPCCRQRAPMMAAIAADHEGANDHPTITRGPDRADLPAVGERQCQCTPPTDPPPLHDEMIGKISSRLSKSHRRSLTRTGCIGARFGMSTPVASRYDARRAQVAQSVEQRTRNA